jgi:hypothetical protein
MGSIRVTAVIETDGELRISNLPCRKGDRVEAIVILPDGGATPEREAARQRFLDRAGSMQVRSSGSYPSRDQLHERP